MQTKTTNILLGVIGIALLAVVVLLITNRKTVQNEISTGNTQTETQGAASLDTSSQDVKSNEVFFKAEFAKPANFNGHYRVASITCGSSCEQYYVIDKLTGKVYKAPLTEQGTSIPFTYNMATYSIDTNNIDFYYTVDGQKSIHESVFINGQFQDAFQG